MNKLIEQTGTSRSLVYVGGECLLFFPTNQQAWEHLSALSITADEEENPWPEEVYIAFTLDTDGLPLLVPQIGKIVKQEKRLEYKGLFGPKYHKFRQVIVDNWPNIKEGLEKRRKSHRV